ncbi:hypothetical protein SCLCIDRAFT_111925 [Scleroderma citrinum Foug A]|uniref:Crinkler effector protein N-terminal domain-containing protein n=1 Tax=Scleroderma citrinum Foug A TaxID=1036808 RepID=A0A0C3ECA5_9AGAM|nr:hypothetical protein SCLCIDRAFT_111925 [Scleroderma citrinum Foug A]
METLTLNCWVRAQDVSGIFEINISKSMTVGALKKAIKNKQPATFHDIDASRLSLYKPREPVAEPHEENLSNIVLSELGEPLPPLRKLSDLFTAAPPETHIHIIVGMYIAATIIACSYH